MFEQITAADTHYILVSIVQQEYQTTMQLDKKERPLLFRGM